MNEHVVPTTTPTQFHGKVIAVTGGASGLGADIADVLAERGARLAVLDRDGDGAESVARGLRDEHGGEHLAIALDVSVAASVTAAFDEVARDLGPVYGLVNSAGIRDLTGVLDMTPDEWERIVAVNLNGTFYCSQAAARQMVAAGGGSIVNMASVGGMVAFPARPGYTATKAAMIGLTKSFARELGPDGVRVNALCPGVVRTPLTESYFDDDTFVSMIAKTIPLGRAGEPREVSEIGAFLLSDAASLISGVALPVDGAFVASGNLAVVAGDSPFQKSRTGDALPSEPTTRSTT